VSGLANFGSGPSCVSNLHALQAPGRSAFDGYLGFAHTEMLRNQLHQLFVGLAVHRRGGDSSEPRAITQLFELAGSGIRLHFDLDNFHTAYVAIACGRKLLDSV